MVFYSSSAMADDLDEILYGELDNFPKEGSIEEVQEQQEDSPDVGDAVKVCSIVK